MTPSIHPLNKRVSTVETKDIIKIATKAFEKLINGSQNHVLRRHFGTHYTIEDLVMDTVEKVVRANPMYLTRSYIYTAARCVFIDLLYKKRKLTTVENPMIAEIEDVTAFNDPSDPNKGTLESLLIGDSYDYISELEEYVLNNLEEKELELYLILLQHNLYADVAKQLDVSVRTLERQVRLLKDRVEEILKKD